MMNPERSEAGLKGQPESAAPGRSRRPLPAPVLPKVGESGDGPPGIFVPAQVLLSRGLSSQALHTWLILKLLAQGSGETPELTLEQLAGMAGKSIYAVRVHLTNLRSRGVLRWSKPTRDTLVVALLDPEAPAGEQKINKRLVSGADSQPEQAEEPPDLADSPPETARNAQKDKKPSPKIARSTQKDKKHSPKTAPSLKDSLEMNQINPQRVKREAGKPRFQASDSGPPAAGGQAAGRSIDPAEADPVRVYRALVGMRPNAIQRDLILFQARDLALWEETLVHWLAHRWSPMNIPGMLDLYARGGPPGCICRRAPGKTSEPPPDPIEELKKKYGYKPG